MKQLTSLQNLYPYKWLTSIIKAQLPSVYLKPPAQKIPSIKDCSHKALVNSAYRTIHTGGVETLNPPNHIYTEIHRAFKVEGNDYFTKETFVCELENVRLVGPDGYVITSDDKLLMESLWSERFLREQAYVLHRPYLRRLRRRRGTYLCLAMPWSSSYYHWIMDVLPRLALYQHLSGSIDIPIIVSAPLDRFQYDTLALLGISSEQIHPIHDEHWQVDRLIFPSYPGISGESPSWVVQWLRSMFLSRILQESTARLYISRKSARHRRISNEDDVENYLRNHGFQIIQSEKLRFSEQVEMFAHISVIVAPHGAGLTNIVFASNAIVLEIFSPDWMNLCYYRLSNRVGHEYWYLLGRSSQRKPIRDDDGYRDFTISIEELDATLRQLLT